MDLVSMTPTIICNWLWNRYQCIRKEQQDSDKAVALMMQTQFKGKWCSLCGKNGHIWPNCFQLPENKGKEDKYFKKLKEWCKNKNKNGNGKELKPNGQQKCWECGSNNHVRKDCPKRNGKGKDEAALPAVDEELLLMAGPNKGFGPNTWIADSGASSHMTNKKKGFIDYTPSTKTVTISDGTSLHVAGIGKWKGSYMD